MRFTYDSYKNMLTTLKDNGYVFSDYISWKEEKCPVILRHDVDYDLCSAVKLAQVEHDMGIASTYFVLLSSDFYNVHSARSYSYINTIKGYGHSIGLHFDEKRYGEEYGNSDRIEKRIIEEIDILSNAINDRIYSVSMHRPSKSTLEANIEIDGIINSYSDIFFKEFKYISDSRRRWREPIDEIIVGKEYSKLHILTHPFWYNKDEIDIRSSICGFVNRADRDRYDILAENITDIGSIMMLSEVE